MVPVATRYDPRGADSPEPKADPHAIARQSVVEMVYLGLGKIMAANNPLRLSGAPVEVRRLGPRLDEHTRDILREVGYRDAKIDAMAAAKAGGAGRSSDRLDPV